MESVLFTSIVAPRINQAKKINENHEIHQIFCLKLNDSDQGKILSKAGYIGFAYYQNAENEDGIIYRDQAQISFENEKFDGDELEFHAVLAVKGEAESYN